MKLLYLFTKDFQYTQLSCAFTEFQDIVHSGENEVLVWQMLYG